MKEKKEEEESKGVKKKYQPLKDFKIALFAMLSDKDFKTLEAHTMHILTLVLSLAAFVPWLTFKVPAAGVAT
eukprot:7276970-Ditylum_brightwellii.AAC.1